MSGVEETWNIGVDMADHNKFRRFNPLDHPHFYNRVFTADERAYCNNKISRYAGIFAAKEAIYKAVNIFGTSKLSQYEILHTEEGRPFLRDLTHNTTNIIQVGQNNIRVKISISHTKETSIAFAMARLEE